MVTSSRFPQGSVHGLHSGGTIVFFSDLHEAVSHSELSVFADDVA